MLLSIRSNLVLPNLIYYTNPKPRHSFIPHNTVQNCHEISRSSRGQHRRPLKRCKWWKKRSKSKEFGDEDAKKSAILFIDHPPDEKNR
jgi:hypothetical protein